MQNGAWSALPAALRNGGVAAAARRRPPRRNASPPRRIIGRRAALLQRALPLLGIAGLAAWIAFTPLARRRAAARDRPRRRRCGRAKRRSPSAASCSARSGIAWPMPRSAIEDPDAAAMARLRLARGGPAAYRALVGNALAPPLWDVRFARFDGDVAERAEEWRVTVTGDGRVRAGRASACRRHGRARRSRATRRRRSRNARCAISSAVDRAARSSCAAPTRRSGPRARDWVFAYADPRVDVGKARRSTRRRSRSPATKSVSPAARCSCRRAGSAPSPSAMGGGSSCASSAFGIDRAGGDLLALVYAVSRVEQRPQRPPRARCSMSAYRCSSMPRRQRSTTGRAGVAAQHGRAGHATSSFVTVLGAAGRRRDGRVAAPALLAGVGMHYARLQTPVRLAGRLPAWVLRRRWRRSPPRALPPR